MHFNKKQKEKIVKRKRFDLKNKKNCYFKNSNKKNTLKNSVLPKLLDKNLKKLSFKG